jgi:hypothetical protein
MSVHMMQVHKEQLKVIANALPGRDNPDIEIFGMDGTRSGGGSDGRNSRNGFNCARDQVEWRSVGF